MLLLLLACPGKTEERTCAPEGDFREISVGSHHACALTTDGSQAVCWGRIGDATDPDAPFEQIAANGQSSCGLKPTGALECWGQTQWTAPGGEWVQLSLGYDKGYAVDADGSGVIWDANEEYEAVGPLREISGGVDHFCAIRTDETSYCVDLETQPPQLDWREFQSGDGYSCGLTTGGEATCWGNVPEATIPTPPDESGLQAIAPGWSHFCWMDADDGVYCDGLEGVPELEEELWVDVKSGRDWACGLTDAGQVHCWGDCPAEE